MQVHGFPPISDARSRVLILGSMPGKASLCAGQYYAHRQNSFWRIMGALCQFDPAAPYEVRTRCLLDAGIAVWDVMQSCSRESSLDSDIQEASIVVNRFEAFFHRHPKIGFICFNGSKAEQSYWRYVLPEVPVAESLETQRLPSTSPAHASLCYAEKLAAWQVILLTHAQGNVRQLE
ncbi:MAG: DNA-deoxyinosine glycosylase [Pirellulales bacterium]|nr:DNA-deoxyinosine glycosylase [Pirellulales bacterium]